MESGVELAFGSGTSRKDSQEAEQPALKSRAQMPREKRKVADSECNSCCHRVLCYIPSPLLLLPRVRRSCRPHRCSHSGSSSWWIPLPTSIPLSVLSQQLFRLR